MDCWMDGHLNREMDGQMGLPLIDAHVVLPPDSSAETDGWMTDQSTSD